MSLHFMDKASHFLDCGFIFSDNLNFLPDIYF